MLRSTLLCPPRADEQHEQKGCNHPLINLQMFDNHVVLLCLWCYHARKVELLQIKKCITSENNAMRFSCAQVGPRYTNSSIMQAKSCIDAEAARVGRPVAVRLLPF